MWYKYQSQKADTHLLHQMAHHRTTLRGNGQWSATITRITTKTHTTTLTTKRGSSESCAIRNFLRVTLSTGKVGCRTDSYSTSSGTKSGSSSVKIKNGWVQTYSASPTTPTEGVYTEFNAQGKSRIRLEFNLRKANFYAGVDLKERVFKSNYLALSNT